MSSPFVKNTMFNVRRPHISKIVFSLKKKSFEIISQKSKPSLFVFNRKKSVQQHTNTHSRVPHLWMLFQLSSH